MVTEYCDKTALITGASGGLGAGIAKELARRGAHVVILARRKEQLFAVAEEIVGLGGLATPFECDVTKEANLKEVASEVKTRLGKVHLLVNNAGKELVAPLRVARMDKAQEMFDLNVLAMISATKIFLGLMSAGSSIVNMASSAGIQGTAGMSLYSASKGAIIAFTKSLAKELASSGIRVNAVAPGLVRTELFDRMMSKFSPNQVAAIEASHPMGFGTIEDVASAVAFLGGPDARWITGHTLVVDGGLTA